MEFVGFEPVVGHFAKKDLLNLHLTRTSAGDGWDSAEGDLNKRPRGIRLMTAVPVEAAPLTFATRMPLRQPPLEASGLALLGSPNCSKTLLCGISPALSCVCAARGQGNAFAAFLSLLPMLVFLITGGLGTIP
jgi:hypothetical protein